MRDLLHVLGEINGQNYSGGIFKHLPAVPFHAAANWIRGGVTHAGQGLLLPKVG
jgi:hypothetical protein